MISLICMYDLKKQSNQAKTPETNIQTGGAALEGPGRTRNRRRGQEVLTSNYNISHDNEGYSNVNMDNKAVKTVFDRH